MTTIPQQRTFLLLFFLCCSLPVLLAKLALEFGWFTPGITNKGQWLEQEITLTSDEKSFNEKRWHLVYVRANECDQSCELVLYTLQQLYSGLAARKERVTMLILADRQPHQLENFRDLAWRTAGVNFANSYLENQIVLVNPQGVALLHYPITAEPLAMVALAKAIRTDLLRLLAFERSGT